MRSFAKIWQTMKKVELWLEDRPDKLEKELLVQTPCPTLIVFQVWDVPKCDTDLYQVLQGVLK